MSIEDSKVYIAAPIVGINKSQREEIDCVASYLHDQYRDVYCPWDLKIPNAWNMPQEQWARCVFTQDVLALDDADIVVVCDYGRHGSCGTAWEAGYAFAKEKRIIIVQMPDVHEVSLMLYNGCTCVVLFDDFVNDIWEMPNFKNINNPIVQN